MVKNILILQTAFLGDAVLTLPLLQELVRIHAGANIDIIAIEKTKEIFLHSPAVRSVFVLDKQRKHKTISLLRKFAREVALNGYDLFLTPHRSFRTALFASFTGIRETVGSSESVLPFLFSKTIPYMHRAHEVKRNLHFTGELYAGDTWKILPVIEIGNEAAATVDALLTAEEKEKGFAVIAPGSEWETKQFPHFYFAELLRYFSAEQIPVFLIGSDKEKELAESIGKEAGVPFKNVCGSLSVIETIALLRCAKVLIANDSAPVHFAMAVDIPVIALYCSTVPEFGFYPYNRSSCSLSMAVPCKPCGIHGKRKCPAGSFDCGLRLKPDFVIEKIESILYAEG